MQLHAETLVDHEWEINPSPTISNPPLRNRSHFHCRFCRHVTTVLIFLRSNVTAAPAQEVRPVRVDPPRGPALAPRRRTPQSNRLSCRTTGKSPVVQEMAKTKTQKPVQGVSSLRRIQMQLMSRMIVLRPDAHRFRRSVTVTACQSGGQVRKGLLLPPGRRPARALGGIYYGTLPSESGRRGALPCVKRHQN
jgi:hypothetical protein